MDMPASVSFSAWISVRLSEQLSIINKKQKPTASGQSGGGWLLYTDE